MGLITADVIRVDIPHEAGQWVEIRGLVYAERREAQREQTIESQKDLVAEKDLALAIREIRNEIADDSGVQREPTVDDVLSLYHWPTVVKHGLVRWSYNADEAPIGTLLGDRELKFLVQSILGRSGVEFPGEETPTKNSSARSTRR
ncbi:MAG: hypothetical protein Q8Q14_06115 [Gemmatimonadales bacterium]|nr:hypothetical protein [Gemmatimonadales bacterium]